MKVVCIDSKRWQAPIEQGITQDVVEKIIKKAYEEIVPLLPPLSKYLTVVVRADASWVVPETGDLGMNWNEEETSIYFDPELPYGAENLKERLRIVTFHELNHAARRIKIPFENTPTEDLVAEGLATVFERDHAGSKPLWGAYEDDLTMQKWYKEILALPSERNEEYLFDHSDGRRWIIYKTGTWLIDTILKNNTLTIQELTTMPAKQVIALASKS